MLSYIFLKSSVASAPSGQIFSTPCSQTTSLPLQTEITRVMHFDDCHSFIWCSEVRCFTYLCNMWICWIVIIQTEYTERIIRNFLRCIGGYAGRYFHEVWEWRVGQYCRLFGYYIYIHIYIYIYIYIYILVSFPS